MFENTGISARLAMFGVVTALGLGVAVTSWLRAEQEPSEEDAGRPIESVVRKKGERHMSDAANFAQATFGSGCFWCTEAVFDGVRGVKSAISGYSGGEKDHPTYKEVCTGETGHAEVIQLTYDPAQISYPELLEIFWKTHDPTTLNRQGNDVGTQYRSVVFYHDETQRQQAEEFKEKLNTAGAFVRPIVTQIAAYEKFFPAEDDHQQYYELNGRQPYCQIVIRPKLEKFKEAFGDKLKGALPADSPTAAGGDHGLQEDDTVEKTEAEWKAQLTPEQFHVTRKKGTERAFSGAHWNNKERGVYRCVCCDAELFHSDTKYESGTGWPSFWKPIDGDIIAEEKDRGFFMVRTEVKCSRCDAHLGHVFDDGPEPTGLRYCLNSAALNFDSDAAATENAAE